MKCPKCGYARRMGESAPEWQCPSCGVAYAKASAASARAERNAPAMESGSGGKIVLAGIALFLVVVGYAFIAPSRDAATLSRSDSSQAGAYEGASIVMYSLTTCGYCNQKRAELRARGIPFVEYFVDNDEARRNELFEKLRAVGHTGGVGTPTFEVNGKMLPNNPSIETIIRNI
jgi:glutaredoxin